jgi:DNA-binding HxlR family transcriptional regulator
MSTVLAEKQDVPLTTLVQLCHYRWGVGVVAALWETRGCKFVTLVNRLGVSRDALSRTLAGLDDLGLAMHNPGYGHPMRPEYLLTPDGETAGPAALDVFTRIRRAGLEDPAGRKWSLPALAALKSVQGRFSTLEAALTGITPRALTLALKGLEEAGLASRVVIAEHPPRTEYRVTRRGSALASSSLKLAKALEFNPLD